MRARPHLCGRPWWTLAACAALVCAAPAGARAAGRWVGVAEAGFDSYIERYSIAEDDTLSSVNEAYTRLRFGYATGSLTRNYVLIETRQLLGQSSYESALHAMATRRFGNRRAWTANFDGDVARRGFREGSVYELSNDYTRTAGRAAIRARARRWLTLRVDDRIEWLNYDQRTEFDYDYTRNALTAAADFDHDALHGVSAGVRYTTMSIPDSSEIEYHAVIPFVEGRIYGDVHQRAYLSAAVERRTYPAGGTRSSFYAFLVSGLVEFPVYPGWSIELASDLENYAYDAETDAYPDYLEVRNYAALGWHVGGFRTGAGPAFAWLSSRTAPQDEYHELGVRLFAELLGTSGLFVSLSYEPGTRDYGLYDASNGSIENADAIFSDYTYHRLSLFANSRIRGHFWLNAFADYQPEDHDRTGDDATATVASIALMVVF